MNDKIYLFLNKNKWKLSISILLLLNVVVLFSFGARKNGYNVDELYTYGLSNSYFDPFIDVTENTQLSNEYIQNYFTVQEEEKFAYDSVYDNQSRDVHPPLYYFLFHTVSSFLPNVFSKWIGISLNIVFFILAWIILYKLAKLILKDKYLALAVPLTWGLSAGAISSVVFIRMYVLMTVFVLLTTYLHARTIKTQVFRSRDLLAILLTTFLGVMTHYYFVIFAFFISAGYFFYLLVQKKLKFLLSYVVTMSLSLVLSVLFYPAMLTHIFSGYRGTEAVSSITNSTSSISLIFDNFSAYYTILNQAVFNGILSYLLIAVGVVLIVVARKKFLLKFQINEWKTQKKTLESLEESDKTSLILLVIFTISAVMYVFIIAQVAPYKADRYVFPIFPLVLLVFVYLIKNSLFYFIKSRKLQLAVIALFTIISLIGTYANNTVNYLYENRKMDYLTDNTKIQNDNAILFYNNDRVVGAQITNAAQYLYYHPQSYIFNTTTGIEQLKGLNLDENETLIYFGYAVEDEIFVEKIIEETRFEKYTLIDDSIGVYLLE